MPDQEAKRKARLLDFILAYDQAKHRGDNLPLAEWQERFDEIRDDVAVEFAQLERTWEANRDPSTHPGSDSPDASEISRDDSQSWDIGHYKILKELGHGGQGQVYLAEDHRTQNRVALKVLNGISGDHEDALIRFRREAEIASKLNHKGICAVHEIGNHRGRRFIAMQYIDGKSLSQIIRESDTPRTGDGIRTTLQIIEEAAQALHSAHDAHVVHRDIKPSNIMLDQDGSPVIVDFGLARDTEDEAPTLTATGSFCGTLPYMSPERLSGKKRPVDRQADVYALGVTMYELLGHQLPFQAATPETLQKEICHSDPKSIVDFNPEVPKTLAVVIATAMEKDLGRRYLTALDLAEDVRRVIDDVPILAQPIGPVLRVSRWIKRNTWVAAMIVVLLVIMSLLFFFLQREEKFTKSLLRLSDDRSAVQLLNVEQTELYPVEPQLVPKAKRWLNQSKNLLARRRDHEATRAQISRREGESESATIDGSIDVSLAELVNDLLGNFDRLAGRMTEVEKRIVRAQSIEDANRDPENLEKWRRCIEAIAKSKLYGGLVLTPQRGLVPLGVSELTGFWEFLHVDSGAPPEFDKNRWADSRWEGAPWDRSKGEWIVTKETGIILVLLPGGTFSMGARLLPANENLLEEEQDLHDVTLDPFFISKYEMTQAQWARCREGEVPSWYFPGTKRAMNRVGAKPITWMHPVESITWKSALQTLQRITLTLPTESQWEYAARGGTTSAYSCGDTLENVSFVANLLGEEMPAGYSNTRAPLNDNYITTSPVGALGPNPFGLYDVHGNISEWCLDQKVQRYNLQKPSPGNGLRTPSSPTELRAHRGGNYKMGLSLLRSASRLWSRDNQGFRNAGVRPARTLVQ